MNLTRIFLVYLSIIFCVFFVTSYSVDAYGGPYGEMIDDKWETIIVNALSSVPFYQSPPMLSQFSAIGTGGKDVIGPAIGATDASLFSYYDVRSGVPVMFDFAEVESIYENEVNDYVYNQALKGYILFFSGNVEITGGDKFYFREGALIIEDPSHLRHTEEKRRVDTLNPSLSYTVHRYHITSGYLLNCDTTNPEFGRRGYLYSVKDVVLYTITNCMDYSGNMVSTGPNFWGEGYLVRIHVDQSINPNGELRHLLVPDPGEYNVKWPNI